MAERNESRPPPTTRGSASGGVFGGRSGPTATMTTSLVNRRTGERSYQPAQLGPSHPHEELALIVSCADGFAAAGEVVSGALSETGAMLLLVRDDQTQASPLSAAGEFKLWVRNGSVVKYQLRLEGILLINRRKVPAHLTAVTTLHEVGTTRLVVPDEVRLRLE